MVLSDSVIATLYLVSSLCFILALRGLSSAKTSRMGNFYGMVGMTLAIGAALLSPSLLDITGCLVAILLGGTLGTFIALKIQMTALPQLVAAFHSLIGLAAVFIAAAAFIHPETYHLPTQGSIPTGSLIEMGLGVSIGALTFTGSVIAFLKLQGILGGKPLVFKGQHVLNALLALGLGAGLVMFSLTESSDWFVFLTVGALMLGALLILPIGGADMPVVISMLNSYSGWAASGIGFTLNNTLLIITGALVGSSGAILSYIMCKAMNRSIFNVILGGLGSGAQDTSKGGGHSLQDRPYKTGNPEDAAFILQASQSVIIVPGYGMAVAQAQHALKELGDILKHHSIKVRYAIHPVAGRMPGHMNVLLAEAHVPYDDVLELEDINRDFAHTDVAIVIGANDVTNPLAKTDPSSPIYGMPILDVEKARTVFFIKRSMATGYAGVENDLFYRDNTMMLFGDAKKVVEAMIKAWPQ